MLAVEGDPDTTVPVPMATPSSMKVTFPVAAVALVLGAVMEADTPNVLPAVGTRVAGVTTTVGAVLATLRVTAEAVEAR
jgi:hypothetical protein